MPDEVKALSAEKVGVLEREIKTGNLPASYNSPEWPTQRQWLATVRDRERQIARLERTIQDMPAIAAGIKDAIAGRVKSLSCVEGGCERDELQKERDQARKDNYWTTLKLQAAVKEKEEAQRTSALLYAERLQYKQERNELQRRLAETRKAQVALKTLVSRLDEVHADPRYESVWTLYAIHGGRYTEPTYTKELEQAREAIDASQEAEHGSERRPGGKG